MLTNKYLTMLFHVKKKTNHENLIMRPSFRTSRFTHMLKINWSKATKYQQILHLYKILRKFLGTDFWQIIQNYMRGA